MRAKTSTRAWLMCSNKYSGQSETSIVAMFWSFCQNKNRFVNDTACTFRRLWVCASVYVQLLADRIRTQIVEKSDVDSSKAEQSCICVSGSIFRNWFLIRDMDLRVSCWPSTGLSASFLSRLWLRSSKIETVVGWGCKFVNLDSTSLKSRSFSCYVIFSTQYFLIYQKRSIISLRNTTTVVVVYFP